jgi:hypothetical protein
MHGCRGGGLVACSRRGGRGPTGDAWKIHGGDGSGVRLGTDIRWRRCTYDIEQTKGGDWGRGGAEKRWWRRSHNTLSALSSRSCWNPPLPITWGPCGCSPIMRMHAWELLKAALGSHECVKSVSYFPLLFSSCIHQCDSWFLQWGLTIATNIL